MRWAIVIGIDEYRVDELRLHGAVRDAVEFRAWVGSDEGGNVPEENVRLLLGRREDDPGPSGDGEPTKANVVKTINDVVRDAEAAGEADKLYFFFSGHGITADLAGREESALVFPGFDARRTDHSLAIRSLTEHLETTLFKDQFFFIDACRDAPPGKRKQIGRWPIPRRRDPGEPPVQQFVLYATSPGLTAREVGWFDEAVGAFSEVLMQGLQGEERAKAWSWERNCYEVRWERLATYVNTSMTERRIRVAGSGDPPPGGWPMQIPQDAGSRGVANRDRDPRLAAFPRGRFGDVELTLEFKADRAIEEAEVTVLDATGTPVVRALRVPGSTVKVPLPPRTYAARVETSDPEERRVGNVKAPIELYDALTDEIELRLDDGPAAAMPGTGAKLGKIVILSNDPLSTAEVRDESGRVIAVRRCGEEHEASPGFYRVRHLRPERAADERDGEDPAGDANLEQPAEETFVVLSGDDRKRVRLRARPPAPFVVRLAEALGGRSGKDYVVPYSGAEPLAWAHPSTVLAAAMGAALNAGLSLGGLGLEPPREALAGADAGIALYAVAGDGDPAAVEGIAVRTWPAGAGIPAKKEQRVLEPSEHAVAGTVAPAGKPGPHWISIERGNEAIVLAVPVLPNRLATLVVQVEPTWMRLYQFHPAVEPETAPSSSAERLRRLEHLERLLLGGALDGARPLAEELAAEEVARDDPFAGLLAGYVLLRLGLYEPLDRLASKIVEVAPTLSDAYILRGEYEAEAGRIEAAQQAFADAVNAGVPAFGEGLTRLVEGLRTSAFHHPRGALVRHIFRGHVRGMMWAAFTPSRQPLTARQLVISGADIGYEG